MGEPIAENLLKSVTKDGKTELLRRDEVLSIPEGMA
jgi:hypothetical protein